MAIKVIAFDTFKHLAYVNDLRSRLKQPLRYNLSDSCAQSLSFEQLRAMGDEDELATLNLGYATVQGSAPLRQAIAQLHQASVEQYPNLIGQDNVVTFCGAQEALFATFNHLIKAGDEVIIVTPCYPSIQSVPQQLGATVKAIELTFERQWQFTIEDVKAQIGDKTRLIVLNSPHNPTGSVMPRELALDIIELARERGIYILSDEVSVWSDYNELGIHHPFLSYEKAIAIGVMSKSFGLAGVRIGWAVSQDKTLLQGLMDIKGYTSICGSATDEYLAKTALHHHKGIVSRNNLLIQKNIEAFELFVEQSEGRFKWHKPQAGILTLVKFESATSVRQLAEKMAFEQQLLILPGDLFGIEGNYFRLGLGRADFSDALARL
jgi:aspartate/methionine/tyrosine aminotransferase